MSLFTYELKKVSSKRIVWIILGLFLLLDIVKIGMLYNDTIVKDTLADGRQAVIDEIKGAITNEKISFIIGKKRELDDLVENRTYKTEYDSSTYTGYQFGDSIVFSKIYDDLDYAYHYEELIQKVKTKAEENLALYPSDSYEAKIAQKILDTYSNRRIINYYDTVGYEAYFAYDFSTLLILLFLLFTLTPIFSEESEVKMNLLILSSPNGKDQITKAKLSSAFAIALGTTLIFLMLDFLLFMFLFRLDGGQNPLYSLQSFAYTTFNGSIIQYAAISVVFKLIGSIFFSLLYLLFSSFFMTVLPALIWSGSTLLLIIFANDFISFNWLQQLSALSLFTNRTLFHNFAQLNCFNIPVNSVYLLLTVVIVSGGIILAVIMRLQSKSRVPKQKYRRRTV